MPIKYRLGIFALFAINIFAAICCTSSYLISQNTLEHNGQWIPTKATLKFVPLSGSGDFYQSTQALAGGRMNLGAWHGFQEIIYRRTISPREISFDFALSKDSYLVFVFNKDDKGFNGLRIGNYKWFDSIYFTASPLGEFLAKQRVEVPELKPNQRQHMRVVFEKDSISFFLNGKPLETFKIPPSKGKKIGFRGSYSNVYVDNIIVKDDAGKVLFKENFDNERNFWLIFFVSILGMLLLGGIFKFYQQSNEWIDWFVFSGTVLILSVAWLYYVSFTFARYTKIVMKASPQDREQLVKHGRDYVDEIESPNAAVSPEKFRIVFIGTSQTKGVGVMRQEETFVSIIEKILNSTGSHIHYECINAAVPGINTRELFTINSSVLPKLNPNLVVINLSNNEFFLAEYKEYLSKFAELLKGIPTIFVLEANTVEIPNNDLGSKHAVMRQVAAQYGIPVIDLNQYLREKSDTGLLWWDFVHLTAWGQLLTGRYLADEILKIEKDTHVHEKVGLPIQNQSK